ncbi:hypothetical protein EW146_g6549 [Bondarzewia mesenterica]|uniref:Uncharacterized protein n=1 Tax=Bondarzewia mesenterica TaxID=1095465 RepID=A0A4S4LQ45_9AGAM|nr:hypothetical protein EW146_g6549 [Bondarzewia mesenterica]
MNFTLDDASSQLAYTTSWEVQSRNDPDLSFFFQSTYHAALADGAQVNITFSGSAIYLYGSKGPEHGKFTVQCDNVIANLDAHSEETQLQQLLFSYTFPNSSISQPHFVSLTTRLSPGSNWFDLDYVTFSQASKYVVPPIAFRFWRKGLKFPTLSETQSQSPGNNVQSLTAPWVTASSGASSAGPLASSTAGNSAGARNSENKATLIVAAILGSILGLVVLVIFALLFLRWRRKDLTKVRAGPQPMPSPQFSSGVGPAEEKRKLWSPFRSGSSFRGMSDNPSLSSTLPLDNSSLSRIQFGTGSQLSVPVVPPRPTRGLFTAMISPSPTPGRYDDVQYRVIYYSRPFTASFAEYFTFLQFDILPLVHFPCQSYLVLIQQWNTCRNDAGPSDRDVQASRVSSSRIH